MTFLNRLFFKLLSFTKIAPVVLAMMASGCVTLPGQTQSQKVQSALMETVSCTVPEQPTANYDYDAKTDHFGPNNKASTDYFKLVVNYSPAFCANKKKKIKHFEEKEKKEQAQNKHEKYAFQCFSENKFGWILHGLWSETCNGKSMEECRDWSDIRKHPRLCKGDLPALDYQIIKPYLCTSPGIDLLQAEWEKHGACDFDTAENFFSKQQELFNGLVLPEDRPSNKELIQFLKEHNPVLKDKYIQINRNEFYICYSKDFEVIDCPKPEHQR
ncbi:ribonuclease [Xenorhabdus sp. 42]|uniref:ribonuclease T2 family protein n=1 Tax=Xenorhabdus szentirmaii TaxID=290112 RepID=UPI0019C74048|nr:MULTISPECIES: ribonuclease [unclassified Xenorhabdus]MBD2779560.1 ribonuclease [Xenorhabdus sp. 38]MBD2790914.1 ribonuclease [Xenorhabdus sp. CUL]MBD2820262.1 ribonuclease [Xenorhabdus sp. 42]